MNVPADPPSPLTACACGHAAGGHMPECTNGICECRSFRVAAPSAGLTQASERLLRDFDKTPEAIDYSELSARLWLIERAARAVPNAGWFEGYQQAVSDIRHFRRRGMDALASSPAPAGLDDGLREALVEWLDVRNSVTEWTGPADWTAEDGYNAAIEEVEAIMEGQQVAPGLPSFAATRPAEDAGERP